MQWKQMRFRERKGRACDTVRYVLEKALRISQRCTIQQTVTTSQKPSPPGPSKNKNQSFRARLIKMLEKDSDDLDSPPENVKINSASIEEISDPVPPSGKGKGTPKLDFPLGLQRIMSVIYSQRKVYSLLAHKSRKQYWNLVIIQHATRLPPLKFQLHFEYTERKYRLRL